MESQEYNYRQLLINYIRHVGSVEGSTFIRGWFSEEDDLDAKMLLELEKEAFPPLQNASKTH